MSKFDALFSKVDVYEKLSIYGDRLDFLQSLSQDYQSVSDKDLTANINSVKNAVQNWINNDAEKQEDLPGGQIRGLPPGLRSPYQVIRSINTFDADTLPQVYQALLQLSTVNNLGNMGGDAKSAWLQSVFPVLGTAMKVVKQQIDYIKAWSNKFPVDDAPTENANYHTNSEPTPVANTKHMVKSKNEEAKSLSKILNNKIEKLPNSPNRAAELKNINEYVKSLQNHFKALQHNNDLQSYFARMEIAKSLQNAYNTLDYNDLDLVSALNSGRGVPENPDSKI